MTLMLPGRRLGGRQLSFFLILLLILLVTSTTASTAAAAAAAAATAAAACYDSAEALQQAINAVPPNNPKIVDLWLCGKDDVVEVKEPIRIVDDRSIRIGCRSRRRGEEDEDDEVFCTLKSHPEKETRLIEMISSSSSSSSRRKTPKKTNTTPTVQLNHIRLEGGESYNEPPIPALLDGEEEEEAADTEQAQERRQEDGASAGGGGEGGGAIFSKGYNLILEDCQLINNVASQKGGAISLMDDHERPILFLLTRTIFQDNLSIGDGGEADCHSFYFYQNHPGTTIELNTENDFFDFHEAEQQHETGQQEESDSPTITSRLDYWDDPAQASIALQSFRPNTRGASLCF